ncbi:MAG TPA: HAD-IIIA family hydrolase [Thermoanaerobaculia bacterium]|nr:HAD-IIIA family hydrolase [Thermoanaerobaculia bacterium]
MRAVIVAGGLGTRMGELSRTLPKPLLPFGGRPLLAHLIEQVARAGLSEVTLLTGHLSEEIERSLPGLAPPGVSLRVAVEPRPSGSGGCLRYAGPENSTLLVLFGDVLLDMDLAALVRFHQSSGGIATAVVHPNDHPHDSDLAELGPGDRITALHRKPHPPGLLVRNQVTAGVFVLEPELLRAIPEDRPADLVHHVLAPAVERGEPVFGYRTAEYLKDVGTPERYRAVTGDWERGLVAALHRSRPRPAAFLDRDGTLNVHDGYIARPEDLRLLPGAAQAVRLLNRARVRAIVVTNQPVLARGLCDERTLERIHARLEMELGAEGAFLDALYYCPHHPDRGFPGEVPALKIDCACRKPGTGLIEEALRDFAIDLPRSALFGDTLRDAETARRAGIPPWLVGWTGPAPPGAQAAPDLLRAVEEWLGQAQVATSSP